MKTWLRSALSRAPQAKSGNANSQLVALQLAGQARWTPRDYNALSREGYQRNAVAYRCIRLIAEAAASVPLCARRDDKCIDDEAAKLLRCPNPKLSRAEFF